MNDQINQRPYITPSQTSAPDNGGSAMPLDAALVERLSQHGLVLFDGECGFCQFWVRFMINRDPREHLLFAPLQSDLAANILNSASEIDRYETIIFYQDGRIYYYSEAALRIASELCFPWNLFGVLRLTPRFIRDPIYRFIAKRRHSFSKRQACPIPSEKEQERFIS
jgi:predicted DCC family thiol-disulfide oxidoreductase YuxK